MTPEAKDATVIQVKNVQMMRHATNVNVHVYGPDTPMSSTNCAITHWYYNAFNGFISSGENSTHFLQQ